MTTQKFNKIDVSKLSVGKIKNSTNMRTFFIDYDNKLFSVQTPELMLDWGGVPKVDEYHITDADRRYIQTAPNHNHPRRRVSLTKTTRNASITSKHSRYSFSRLRNGLTLIQSKRSSSNKTGKLDQQTSYPSSSQAQVIDPTM